MSLLDSWMPACDVAARYSVRIDASPAKVYSTLLSTDFSRPWLVRALMGVRLLPALVRAPVLTWPRLVRPARSPRASLADGQQSDFVRLEEVAPREIVLGITGRFWTLAAEVSKIPRERFRDALPAGTAQAAWNFEVTEAAGGAELSTETRVRCADPATLRRFKIYWRLVAPGSGLIRYAILRQVRREATAVLAVLLLLTGLTWRASGQAAKMQAPTRAQIISAATDVMKAARYTTLVTLGADGRPQARIVDPAAPEKDLTIWIATNPLTRKVSEIQHDGRVTLLYFDSKLGEYVTVIGTATLVTDSASKVQHWKADWAPFYKSGPRGSDYELIRVKPSRFEVVSPTHKITSDPKTWLPASIDLPQK